MSETENQTIDQTTGGAEPELPIRNEKTGRFVPGNKAHNKYVIERKKEKAAPILAAITEEFTSDEIRIMVRRAYATALEKEDWKGQLEVLRFVAAYAIGKPIARTASINFDKNSFLELFRPRDEEDDDEGVIDVESD